MRRSAVWLAVAVAAASMTGVAFAARHPELVLVKRAPLEIRGIGFRPHETVRVSSGSFHIRVRSSARGLFVVTFPAGDRCSGGARVAAVGSTGERAVLRVPPVLCPPASVVAAERAAITPGLPGRRAAP